MSSANQPAKDCPPPASPAVSTNERRASFLSSLFSIPSTAAPPSPSTSTLSGSPASSIASPVDPKFSPIDWNHPAGSPHSRQTSLSDSLSGLTSSFRWPGSATATAVQPIQIPNSSPSLTHTPAGPGPTSMSGASAPTRRTSVGGPAFRRAFELPTYTNTYSPIDPSPADDKPAQSEANRRGRSGSLFSSFGGGDASKRAAGPPRRKLSPMGERVHDPRPSFLSASSPTPVLPHKKQTTESATKYIHFPSPPLSPENPPPSPDPTHTYISALQNYLAPSLPSFACPENKTAPKIKRRHPADCVQVLRKYPLTVLLLGSSSLSTNPARPGNLLPLLPNLALRAPFFVLPSFYWRLLPPFHP
ncbi:hypothetical protein PtA15_18A236 [Puccinia triticina]|uniref:Proteophosphoglycan ppg4 n=1 Tax=Puccinia triticina TaxID=208348 RepID=A0ABY7D9A1_9BASI|nr:uncharacterized protein PtA15_18A236 [Puccinia triticina]WAQ93178.1 hypothetical protein PtA15_18A236 [Puccinia triticina]